MGESIKQFIDRQNRRVSRLGRDAEAVAHEAYKRAIRAGEDLKLSSPGDVMQHGAKLLQEYEGRAADAISNEIRKAKRQAEGALERGGQRPAVRSAAVNFARLAGNAGGVVRGGVHAVQGLADGAAFANRLLDPLDRLKSPEGESAVEKLGRDAGNLGRSTFDYARKRAANPQGVLKDVTELGQKWRRDLDPSATPAAPTFEGELRRNFDIGQNQGELALDVGSLVVGGPAAKAAKGLGRISNVGNVDRYLAQGFSAKAAAHLAEPYPLSRMGHHFVQRQAGLPKSYSDSVFNVLKPEGISRGDFYELHYKVDRSYHGGSVVSGETWSGNRVGLKKYGRLGRLWHGSPPPLKARAAALGAGAGVARNFTEDGEASW